MAVGDGFGEVEQSAAAALCVGSEQVERIERPRGCTEIQQALAPWLR
jgi:hypothetical protein